MVKEDIEFLKKCIERGVIFSPVLELGVGYEGVNCKEIIEKAGFVYFGTDMHVGKYVDFIINFEESIVDIQKTLNYQKFGTILVFNVLEHVFNPIKVLDNVFEILKEGGTCVIITPVVWPLHGYPRDYWRINPDFYEEYARRRKLEIVYELFEYVGKHNVKENKISGKEYKLPAPAQNKFKMLWSRIIHRVFNTCGRQMFFPSHVSVGVVIRKP